MPSILKALKLLSDPGRIRLLLLLAEEELSVAELQNILGKGQSQISTLLAQLKAAGMVTDRRTGKNIYYRALSDPGVSQILRSATPEIPEAAGDRAALELVQRKRQDKMRAYFDELAGKFGRNYVPGRSWQGLAEALLRLLPPMDIADLGAGEGTVAQLLAQRARRVIAVDSSEKMVQYGTDLAARHGIANLEYRLGDLESVPIENESIDLAFFSQALHHARHPDRALAEARRILRAGGRIVILDLQRHTLEQARELYADVWLGFPEVELRQLLAAQGFTNIETSTVHREAEAPHFETLLAAAEKR